MRKLFLIALKDLTLIFRDPSALVLMLLAPFLLTVGMGLLTGRFSGNQSSGINNIPLVIVNQDEGELGKAMEEMFRSPELGTLVKTTILSSPEEAQQQVDANQFAGAIIVPPGFTASIIPPQGSTTTGEMVPVVFYANPTSPTYAGILRSILDQFISQVEIGRIGAQVSIRQLLEGGYISPEQAIAVGTALGEERAQSAADPGVFHINSITTSGEAVTFDILAYMAPGMALMFLMFTVTYGGRSLLLEKRQGTLPRMLVSPSTAAQILGGKVFGIYLTAVAQLSILIGGTSVLFRLQWGDPLAVLLLMLTAAFGATGWGMLIAAFLKTPGQIASVGSAMMLLFGILGGSFFDINQLPDWVRYVGRITPNAWGIEGFYTLGGGGSLRNVVTPILALTLMGALLFGIASWWFARHGLARE